MAERERLLIFASMKRLHTLLLLLFSALVWVGCSYEPAPELRRAELLLEGRPDSILNVLKAVDRDSLPSDRDRAYHAVLLNWAYVENFKELKDDSLIHQALEFYRQHGPDSMLMQSIYLSGLTDQQRHRGISSMRKAEEGFKMAEKADDPYWMGKFALMMTAGFEYSYNAVEALQYAERSAAYFKKAGRTRNYYDSMIKIITYNNTLKNYRRADELIDSMLSLEDIKKDRRLRNIYIGNRLYRQICTGDYDGAKVSADTLLKYYSEDELDSYSYWYLAKIAGHEKRYGDMKRYLDMGSAKMQYSGDTLAMLNGWFAYYNGLKDSANLIHCYDSCLRMQNNLVLNVMKQSGVTEQRNMARIDLLESERRRTRDTSILSVALGILAVGAGFLWMYMGHKARLRRQELDERMNALFELRTEYEKATARIDELAAEASRASDAASRNAADAAGAWEAFRTTHRRRWETLNRICTAYMNDKSKGANQSLAADVRKEFERMRQPQFLKELEELLDKSNGRLMERFRRDFAGRLSDDEMTMALLMFSGVPAMVVTYITGQSRSQVYRMRQNLIDRLEAMGAPAAPYIDKLAGRE